MLRDRRSYLLWLLLWGAIGSRAAAADSTPTASQSKTAGVRVFYTGHSFHMFVPERVEQLVKSAGIQGHQLVGTQGIGGSRVIQHWELTGGMNKARSILEAGQADVFTMAAHLLIPDAGITNFTELGLKHNPQLRLLVQGSWFPYDTLVPAKKITDNAQRDAITIADLEPSLETWRKMLEGQVDTLNKEHGHRVVFIVPVGAAVLELRKLIVDGKFPGITQQSKLFRDPIGHGQGHVMALASYCNFAVIYRRSPEGLKLPERGVDDAQHAILQRIAWETVSQYPYAGVSSEPAAGK